MPVDRSKIDGLADPNADQLGFSDDAFDARYHGEHSRVPGSEPAGRTTAPRPNPHAALASPRSRNSFMRARARRSAGPLPP